MYRPLQLSINILEEKLRFADNSTIIAEGIGRV